MKKFVKRFLIICIVPLALFMVFNVFYYKLGNYSRLSAFEVYEAIDLAGTETGYTTLVLGDSVGRQFFNPEYQGESAECCYLATNQAITVAGNYILFQRFLENNTDLEKVYYVLRPDSLKSGVNFIYTYSYFVTPLFHESYEQYLFPETVQGIEDVFGRVCAERGFPKWMMARYPKMLEIYNNTCDSIWQIRHKMGSEKQTPDMSIMYLAKMKQVCDEHEIELHLICAPLPDGFVFDMDSLENEMHDAGLDMLYEEYVSDLQYVDRGAFVDGIHLTREYLNENRERFIEEVIHGIRTLQ